MRILSCDCVNQDRAELIKGHGIQYVFIGCAGRHLFPPKYTNKIIGRNFSRNEHKTYNERGEKTPL